MPQLPVNLGRVLHLSLTLCIVGLGCQSHDKAERPLSCTQVLAHCHANPLTCPTGTRQVTLECGCGCIGEMLENPKVDSLSSAGRPMAEDRVNSSQKTTRLPPSNRVFSVDLEGDGVDELIGAHGAKVWLYRLESGRLTYLKIPSEGVLQAVTMGTWAGERRIFMGFGRGRGALHAPVEVFAGFVDCSTWTSIFRVSTQRSDISNLIHLDAKYGVASGLMLSFYRSKYQVETLRLTSSERSSVHGPQRMANQVVVWRNGQTDEAVKVVGRIYGDERGEPGDLSVYATGRKTRRLPIQGGVRSVRVAKTRAGQAGRLYVSDGWDAAYAKKAKAQLKEIRLENDGYIVSQVGQSLDEYTFFEIWPRDLDGDGLHEVLTRGNRYLTQFTRTKEGWRQKRLTEFEPVLNVAVLKRDPRPSSRWVIAIPHGEATRLVMKENREVTL